MRRNRAIRDRIEAVRGPETAQEVELWSDGFPEPLSGYGVALAAQEEQAQADVLDLMAREEHILSER